MTVTRSVDVAVVGAGTAGLVCARELVRAGRDVMVIEARDRVGGRLLNHHFDDGNVVELGGQWVGPTQDRILALIDELGLETFPTYVTGEVLFPDLDEDGFTALGNAFATLEELAATVPNEAPWEAPDAAALDATTCASWIDANVSSAQAREVLELLVGALFTASSAELSMLHVLFYIASAGSLTPALTSVEGGAQELRVVGGTQRVCERMADELGDRVVLSSPVRSISQDGTVEADGLSVTADRIVVAVPPTVCDRIAFDPPLPGHRAQLHRRMAAGSVIKCNVVYDTPWWRDEGLSGQSAHPPGPVTITFDNSPPDDSRGILLGFAEADEARRLGRLSPDARRKEVLDGLAAIFGPRALDATDVIEKVWDDEEWTRGCYGANLPPGGWTRYGDAIREPIGRIHWASAETATRWANYIDGAVEGGQRAAREVLT